MYLGLYRSVLGDVHYLKYKLNLIRQLNGNGQAMLEHRFKCTCISLANCYHVSFYFYDLIILCINKECD